MYTESHNQTEYRRIRLQSLSGFGSRSINPVFDFWKDPTEDGNIRFCLPGKVWERATHWRIPCSEIDAVDDKGLNELIQLCRIQMLIAGGA